MVGSENRLYNVEASLESCQSWMDVDARGAVDLDFPEKRCSLHAAISVPSTFCSRAQFSQSSKLQCIQLARPALVKKF